MIVPAVNYGHIPAAGNDTDLNEERRLFYVALTRTKALLELHMVKGRAPSIFMEGLSNLRNAAQASRAALASRWASGERARPWQWLTCTGTSTATLRFGAAWKRPSRGSSPIGYWRRTKPGV